MGGKRNRPTSFIFVLFFSSTDAPFQIYLVAINQLGLLFGFC